MHPHPKTHVLPVVALLVLTSSPCLPAQEPEPFRGAPGLISLPVGNPYGLDMIGKAAGVDATAPAAPVGRVDFSAARILSGAPLQIDGISVGLDWIISDSSGTIPPPGMGMGTGGWSWAAVLFSVSSTPGGSGEADPIRIERGSAGGAGGDVFSLLLKGSLVPGTPLPTADYRIDLAVDSPEISIYTPGLPSEMDGYDFFGQLYQYESLWPYLPQPPTAYFTITHASTLASPPLWGVPAAEWSGATIFMATWIDATRTWSTPRVYRSPASLGLFSTNDIDAVAVDKTHLWDHGGEEYILFSMVPGQGPNSSPAFNGVGVSFARSGAVGKQAYRESPTRFIDDVIGRGTNVDAVCPLDPGRDVLLNGRVFTIPGPPLPGLTQTNRPSVVWLTPNPLPNLRDVLRPILWSSGCPTDTMTPAPGHGILLVAFPSPFTLLTTFVVGNTARMRESGGFRLRDCPAVADDILLPPAFDLSGLHLDFYWVDLQATPPFAATVARPKGERPCNAGFSLAEGATGGLNGSLVVESVTTASAGFPVPQGPAPLAFQPITHFGWKGYRELVNAGSSTTVQADLDIDRFDAVCQDQRDLNAPHMSLPNGFDLYVCRDATNQRVFVLASLNRATGVMTVLSGSAMVDQGASPTPPSIFLPQFAFSQDGRTGVCVVHDSTNSPVGNQGPPDRILVFKTNPAETFASNNLNVYDASPLPGPNRLHTAYNGRVRIGRNGYGLVEGEEPSGATGAAALWGGPTDGSATWSRITVPNTGTNLQFYWSYSTWRHTADGATDVFLNGGNPSSSTTDMDVMAIRNLGAGPPTVVNITAFPSPTQVQTFGNSTLGNSLPIRGALAPDGSRFAFVIGANTTTSPGQVCIARTDGTNAGAVTPFTQSQFDSQIVVFSELWWLSNQVLLFSAGSAAVPNGDLYAYNVGSGSIINLTQTTTGWLFPPFTFGGTPGNLAIRGSFLSANGKGYYFLRGHATTATGLGTDWKRIDTASLQVTDVTGGATASLRPVSTLPYSWQPRRQAVTGRLFFTSGRNLGVSTVFSDDEVFYFDAEADNPANIQAVQLTSYNGAAGSTASVRRIQDLTLAPRGDLLAYAMGIGTSVAVPENLFLLRISGGTPVQLSQTPGAGGQGIGSGTVQFTHCSPGVVWVQGDNSRTLPTTNTAAMWVNLGAPGMTPLRLTAPPMPAAKTIVLLGANLVGQ